MNFSTCFFQPSPPPLHYPIGLGYRVHDASWMGAAFGWAPTVEVSNGDQAVISHSQNNGVLNLVHDL